MVRFSKKQIVIASIALALIYVSFLMSKDIIRDYDREEVDSLRQEYFNMRIEPYEYQKIHKWKEYEFKAEAELRYPYGTDTPATRILFFNFPGEYYKYKSWYMLFLFAIAAILVYSLREK